MTFFHLIQNFGCAMKPSAICNFLAESLAVTLRYCPLCLAEHHPACYSLLWRFLVLPGCLEHGVYFLDQCGHCGSSLPLLKRRPQLTRCPTCQRDLRTCESSPFSGVDGARTVLRAGDLQWLLTTEPKYQQWTQAKLLKERFQFLRRQRILSTLKAPHRLGKESSLLQRMDSLKQPRQTSLHEYIRYADLLGYSLRQIFYLLV